jgi:P pilus assembly chaperone PapD
MKKHLRSLSRICALATLSFSLLSQARAGIVVNIGKVVLDAGADFRTTRQLEIANTNDKPAEVTVFASDWTQDKTGAVDAVTPEKKAPDSATAWISISPQRFTLAKGERKIVTIAIATPKSAAEMPLKEYRTMVFTETSDTRKAEASTPGRDLQVRVIGRIGTKLFLRNPPIATKLDCEVTKMEETTQDGKRGVLIEVRDGGNVHVQCDSSTIAFRNAAGATVATLPLPAFSVLPGHSRSLFFELPEAGKSKLEKGTKYNLLAVIDYGGTDLVAGELELTY